MTAAELRREVKKTIDELPAGRLRVAADFVDYLRDHASDKSVTDLMKIKAMEHRIRKAQRDAAAGRTRPWREIRRDI